ncbi:MAG TPA: hypothetical protein PKY81_03645 [bacterium]|mgnify:CR=1 FL=1|nr:hypothetical protein [bacterium]HPN30029.1 hypothetical protein [bacterium]
MNDLKQIWAKINSKVNVLLLVIIALIIADVYLLYAAYNAYNDIEVYEKLKPLRPPKPLEKKAIAEIVPFDIENMKPPVEYEIITANNVYINPELKPVDLTKQNVAVIDEYDESDTGEVPIGEMQSLDGYTAKGLITGDAKTVGAVFIEGPGGMSFYGKEGRKLIGTNITVRKIFKDRVILFQPGYKETTISFESEEFLSRWKRNEYIDPLTIARPAGQIKANEPEESGNEKEAEPEDEE